jgi:hypothetical protein
MPSSNFCGCTSGLQKSAHVLNKPIGSCYLKYASTREHFITISVGWPDFSALINREKQSHRPTLKPLIIKSKLKLSALFNNLNQTALSRLHTMRIHMRMFANLRHVLIFVRVDLDANIHRMLHTHHV